MAAKLRDEKITATDLEKYLETRDDFALELFLYREALNLGFEVAHGGSYEDPTRNRVRQFDIRASRTDGHCRLDLAIECKNLAKSYPLLVSRMPRGEREDYHTLIYSRGGPSNSVLNQVHYLGGDSAIYPIGKPVGKVTVQVGRSGNQSDMFVSEDSETYDKWSQALASANHFIQSAAQYVGGTARAWRMTCVLPILVVSDNTLWAVDYGSDASIVERPHLVDEVTLFVGRKYAIHQDEVLISHLHILTKTRAVAFLGEIAKDQSVWDRLFPRRLVEAIVKGL